MGEVDIEIDGFWCKKCEELHPTLYWHEKFDEYLRNRREEWDYQKNIRPNLFKTAVYQDCLPNLGLTEQSFQEACVSCGELTYFTSLKTKQFICSNECNYADNSDDFKSYEDYLKKEK
ncbi:TPA: hypothetical protein U2B37_000552 [Streptococcus suis]|nr:hypothetical protein [Streptococcus suis]HEM6303374.1 hypothetical protein [Streptococcus suis]